jgi:hypothetical protein
VIYLPLVGISLVNLNKKNEQKNNFFFFFKGQCGFENSNCKHDDFKYPTPVLVMNVPNVKQIACGNFFFF